MSVRTVDYRRGLGIPEGDLVEKLFTVAWLRDLWSCESAVPVSVPLGVPASRESAGPGSTWGNAIWSGIYRVRVALAHHAASRRNIAWGGFLSPVRLPFRHTGYINNKQLVTLSQKETDPVTLIVTLLRYQSRCYRKQYHQPDQAESISCIEVYQGQGRAQATGSRPVGPKRALFMAV